MGIMGIEALYPKPNLSCPAPGHEIYPYLLRGLSIERPNQVWSTDITYIPMRGGFLYLVAVMDWFSRFVLSWELSNTNGDRLLSGCAGSRVPLRPTRDLELRSGFPIHRRGFSGAPEKARRQDQHGWTRPRPGQCFHRATVAQLEVRAHLSRRLRQWGRPLSGVGPLLPFLQLSAPAPSARLPHAGRSVPVRVEEEEGVAMIGGFAPPTPQDLSLFLPEWMFFCLPVLPSCFIIGKLDRRIGQRRDATRAPTQARHGWRPSGLLLVPPPHHLSDGQNLSNLWGPPHNLTRMNSSSTKPDIQSTRTSGRMDRISSASSAPDTPGTRTSSNTRSMWICFCRAMRMAPAPSAASNTR